MKKLIAVCIIALTFSSCQEQQKIAFVDNNKVVNDYQKKKDFEELREIRRSHGTLTE